MMMDDDADHQDIGKLGTDDRMRPEGYQSRGTNFPERDLVGIGKRWEGMILSDQTYSVLRVRLSTD